MPRYSIGFLQSSTPATMTPWAVLRAPVGGRVLRVRGIQLQTTSNVAARVGIALAGAAVLPLVPVSSIPVARDPRDAASTAFLDTAWGTAPALPASPVFLKVGEIGGVDGNGLTFVFDEPLIVVPGALPSAQALLGIWNLAGGNGPGLLLNLDYDE